MPITLHHIGAQDGLFKYSLRLCLIKVKTELKKFKQKSSQEQNKPDCL